MSTWYRAFHIEDIQRTFSGDGGLYAAGRWNFLGTKVVYCSQSIALCTLEWLAHQGLSVSGFDYYRYSIEIPDELILQIGKEKLPDGWSNTPATDFSREFADRHLFQSNKHLAMRIPSVLVPEEFNLVINPLHKEYFQSYLSIISLGKHSAPIRD